MNGSTHPPNHPNWSDDIRRVEDKLNDLKVAFEGFVNRAMGRQEIEKEMAGRVSVETYTSDMRSVNDRLARIEASPMRLLAWLGAGTGCASLVLFVISVAFGIITWAVTHH